MLSTRVVTTRPQHALPIRLLKRYFSLDHHVSPPLLPQRRIKNQRIQHQEQQQRVRLNIPANCVKARMMVTTSEGGANQPLRFKNPAVFVCDLQEKFSKVIHEFDNIVFTTQKLLTFANSLSLPVHCTTQTSAKLGATVPSIHSLLPSPSHDKTRFSMYVSPISSALPPQSDIALVGIEAHICITQTALDLRDAGHRVYVMADGVSSCNRGEVLIALDRLRAEPGITVTSSESWMYECVGNAAHPAFRALIGLVKDKAADTRKAVEVLPPQPKM